MPWIIMQTLLLTSAGTNVKEEILRILPKPAKETKVAHIITASKVEPDISYVKKDTDALSALGFQAEDIDIDGKNENELREMLVDKDVIFVQGGNTFYLLKHVRDSGFDIVVKELIEKGVIYIGVSAGSYIACPTIEAAGWKHADKNEVGLTDLTGMNLVPFLITAHYDPKDKDVLAKEISETSYPVKVLTDRQAILVQDGKAELVGEGDEVKLDEIQR